MTDAILHFAFPLDLGFSSALPARSAPEWLGRLAEARSHDKSQAEEPPIPSRRYFIPCSPEIKRDLRPNFPAHRASPLDPIQPPPSRNNNANSDRTATTDPPRTVAVATPEG